MKIKQKLNAVKLFYYFLKMLHEQFFLKKVYSL